jgi:hypothetical protein
VDGAELADVEEVEEGGGQSGRKTPRKTRGSQPMGGRRRRQGARRALGGSYSKGLFCPILERAAWPNHFSHDQNAAPG